MLNVKFDRAPEGWYKLGRVKPEDTGPAVLPNVQPGVKPDPGAAQLEVNTAGGKGMGRRSTTLVTRDSYNEAQELWKPLSTDINELQIMVQVIRMFLPWTTREREAVFAEASRARQELNTSGALITPSKRQELEEVATKKPPPLPCRLKQLLKTTTAAGSEGA